MSAPAAWLAHLATRPYASRRDDAGYVRLLLAMLLAFGWASAMTPSGWIRWLSFGFGWVLVCLATIDVSSFRLPDIFTLPAMAVGLAMAMVLPGRPVVDHLIGAAGGWAAVIALAWTYHRLRGVAGIGQGDAKLVGVAGAWLGWLPLPTVVLIACGGAFAWILARVLLRRPRALRERIAFGAPLCLAIWIVWLHGPLSA